MVDSNKRNPLFSTLQFIERKKLNMYNSLAFIGLLRFFGDQLDMFMVEFRPLWTQAYLVKNNKFELIRLCKHVAFELNCFIVL